MHIQTEKEVTGAVARQLRERTGLAQHQFWPTVGITQSGGARYEKKGGKMPKPVRILLFTLYVAGLKLNASTEDGARDIVRLAHLQASEQGGDRAELGEKLMAAGAHIKQAAAVLSSISN